jgi:hypothetical protein
MSENSVKEITVKPDANEEVSFSVLCQPQSGDDLNTFVRELSLRTVEKFRPTPQTRQHVMDELRLRGFKVKPDPARTKSQSPLVSAHGTVALFESTFKVKLEKHIRQGDTTIPCHLSEWFETASGAEPVTSEIPGALQVALPRPPTPLTPRLPIGGKGPTILHIPGDIAQLTRATRVHREVLPSGDRATGGGVHVAVIDTGFYPHPYYRDHGYRITRIGTPGGNDPEVDDDGHGTEIISQVFACAPDVDLYAIKIGKHQLDALDAAMDVFADIISTSLADEVKTSTLPSRLIHLWDRILSIISAGTTVVAAAGDGNQQWFPAMIPELIAVGGVEVSGREAICVWSGSSSFTSKVFKKRDVPDICGIAAQIDVPTPSDTPTGHPGTWSPEEGTSIAAPQVAGICALLRQKHPELTPAQIKNRLIEKARDISCGTSASGDQAQKGVPDRATGTGLVNAYASWKIGDSPGDSWDE